MNKIKFIRYWFLFSLVSILEGWLIWNDFSIDRGLINAGLSSITAYFVTKITDWYEV